MHRAEYTHIDEVLLDEFSFIAGWTVITMVWLLDRGYTTLSGVQKEAVRLGRKSNSLSGRLVALAANFCVRLRRFFASKFHNAIL